ncbi:MAG: AAA family ATPase [Chlamydiales bacterium]|nr:AAA family ATPase [Chlamydiales bacterium]
MSKFEHISGNEQVKKRLGLLCDKDELPHLLLFCGTKGVGKRLFAEALASTVTTLPDTHILAPEGKLGMHSIQAVRRLLEEVNLAPFSTGKKVFIIDDAERMLPTSANALLKTLEEPPKNTCIILISSAPEKLLATILSRCQPMRFCPLTPQEIAQILQQKHSVSADVAKSVSESSHGSLTLALQLLHQEGIAGQIYSHLAKKRSFVEIAQLAKDFQKKLDAKRKTLEQELKSQYATTLKEGTPAMKQLVEQEMDGAISLAIMQEVHELLYCIQAFFIDIERVEAHVPLYFEQHRDSILSRKIPLERVENGIKQAKLKLERSSPIQNTLESLLLQLNT